MAAIDWYEELDADGNSVWVGASPFSSDVDSGPKIYWRLRQRLSNNRIEWFASHDSELGGDTGDFWLTLEEAKSACQEGHDNIIAMEQVD